MLALSEAFSQSVVINEIVADASRRFAEICDEDGDPEDWIELHNTTGSPVDISGHYLTDDSQEITKWAFATGTTIPANGFLLVFASNKDRTTPGSELHTSFTLNPNGEFLGLYSPAQLPVDFIAPTYPEQLTDISYGLVPPASGKNFDFFVTPTPGTANNTSAGLPAAAVEYSRPSGTFSSPSISVSLSHPNPAATIRYTTNRSVPNASSPVFSTPVTITNSTQLRTRAYVPGKQPGTVTSQTYHLISSDVASFSSELPIVVIDSFRSGRPNNDTPMHWLIYEPDENTGRTTVTGTPTLATRARMKVRGSSTSGNEKFSLAVEAWDENNVDKDVTPLGLPPEADWILSARYNFDRALMRNPLIYELSNQAGRYAVRTRFVEVFINTDDTSTTYGGARDNDYMGVYSLMEKIDREADRVDVSPLDKADTSEPDISGGYIFKKDRLDPGDSGFSVDVIGRLAHVYPKEDIILSSQRSWLVNHLNQLSSALRRTNNPPDSPNHYSNFVDVPAWIDHHWLNTLAMNVDGFRLSGYYHKDRENKVVAGPIWDFDRTMGSRDGRDDNPERWNGTGDSSRTWSDDRFLWWRDLLLQDDALTAHTERWFELRQGTFSTANIHATIDTMAAEISQAAARNFIKWPGSNHPNEVNILKDWLARRAAWIDRQYPMPTFSPNPGTVQPGTTIGITPKAGNLGELTANIYLTTDGSDPRLQGGAPNPDAIVFGGSATGETALALGQSWSYDDSGNALDASNVVVGNPAYNSSSWKHPNYNDGGWSVGNAQLGYGGNGEATEIQSGRIFGFGSSRPTYYFRNTFTLTNTSNILSATAGVVRDDCAIVYLNGREVGRSNVNDNGVITGDDYAGNTVGGDDESTPFPLAIDPSFLVEGVNTIAVEVHQANSGSSDVSFDCFVSVVREGEAGPEDLVINTSTPVLARGRLNGAGRGPGGTIWGPLVSVNYIIGTPADATNLVVSEINYNPTNPTGAELAAGAVRDSDFEFIELANISDTTIDLTGVTVSSAFDFTFNDPSKATLGPGQVTLVIRDRVGFEARYGPGLPIAGVWGDPADPTNDQRLDNDGERIVVTAADRSTAIVDFSYNDAAEWPQGADGEGSTLTLAEPSQPAPDHSLAASWKDSATTNGSPGTIGTTSAFSNWQAVYFTPAQLADPAVSGPLADADLDGLSNLVEFYLGSTPVADNASHRPTASVVTVPGSGDFLAVTFRRTKTPGNVTAEVQATSDLANWSATAVIAGTPTDNGDGTETVVFRDTIPYGTNPHRSLRIAVSTL
ncbi:MAG: CotH kinase family protein [Verrucomicrobiales bacterium]|nr:CotH kinase family protein [Verrucomicrobiales bacterium]